jgi:hypothetical protein
LTWIAAQSSGFITPMAVATLERSHGVQGGPRRVARKFLARANFLGTYVFIRRRVSDEAHQAVLRSGSRCTRVFRK